MQFLKDLVNKRPVFDPRKKWKGDFFGMMICGVAWHLALLALACIISMYVDVITDLNKGYLLVDKDKKCSVYEVGNNRVRVCPSSSGQK